MNQFTRFDPGPSRRSQQPLFRNRNTILVALGALVLGMIVCGSGVIFAGLRVVNWLSPGPAEAIVSGAPAWLTDSAELTIAASPAMAPVLE
ncbi:MAG: hypothetical protein M3Q45_05565, partial [Chloroflexota bacterium]|nr:hypothetical protein [Chloroflexota bacterium]